MPRKPDILYIGNKLAMHGRTPTSIDTLGPLLEKEGYNIYYSGSRLNQWGRLADMLSAIYKHRNKVQLVLIDTYSTAAFYYAWLCGQLCKRMGMKYIPILHGGNLPARLKSSPALCRHYFGNSIMNVAVSGYLQGVFAQADYPVTLIENSIPLQQYPYTKRSRIRLRLLWVRAFHKTYNPQMAVRVLEELTRAHPDASLVMVGPDIDGSMEECRKLAAEKGLAEQIRFTGKLSKQEWITLSTDCDVFINTTDYDNAPVSVLEAMALGIPVISTDAGGISYLVKNNETGLLVPKGIAEDMANEISLLWKDHELAGTLSTKGRLFAEQLDWEVVKHKWFKLFESV